MQILKEGKEQMRLRSFEIGMESQHRERNLRVGDNPWNEAKETSGSSRIPTRVTINSTIWQKEWAHARAYVPAAVTAVRSDNKRTRV